MDRLWVGVVQYDVEYTNNIATKKLKHFIFPDVEEEAGVDTRKFILLLGLQQERTSINYNFVYFLVGIPKGGNP